MNATILKIKITIHDPYDKDNNSPPVSSIPYFIYNFYGNRLHSRDPTFFDEVTTITYNENDFNISLRKIENTLFRTEEWYPSQ